MVRGSARKFALNVLAYGEKRHQEKPNGYWFDDIKQWLGQQYLHVKKTARTETPGDTAQRLIALVTVREDG